MPQLTLAVAQTLAPAQAAELVRVLALEAAWERTTGTTPEGTTGDLKRRQNSFEEYRARLAAYTAAYRTKRVPEITPSGPDRLKAWCETVRALVARAEPGGCPEALVEKAYRMAGRIAARTKRPAAERGSPDPVGCLDAVIAWCDAKPRPDQAAA